MKFLFIDEFKYKNQATQTKTYGLVGILIDAVKYISFKESFYRELQRIGWDKDLELKGRSMFSSNDNSEVKIEDRISFMSRVVNLSGSSTGKTANIHVYVSIEAFNKEDSEFDCYLKNLEKIINKLPMPSVKKKSLLALYYDNNSCLVPERFDEKLNNYLKKRHFNLFESAFSVKSSLKHPGIMFADYVCYFHQTFLQLSRYRKENMGIIIKLLEKSEKGNLEEKEKNQLNAHFVNFEKETKTKELISSLRKVIYV